MSEVLYRLEQSILNEPDSFSMYKDDLLGWIELLKEKQPQLNENQENVLLIMKNIQKRWPHFHPSIVVDELIRLESEYHDALSKTEELQVFKIFMIWALEQEAE